MQYIRIDSEIELGYYFPNLQKRLLLTYKFQKFDYNGLKVIIWPN